MIFDMSNQHSQLVVVISVCSCLTIGCNRSPSSFHREVGWNAQDYFEDSQVVELCKAIEANNLEEVQRHINAGADVDAKGRGNMTPLLWAFPIKNPAIFVKLLELGADPNVVLSQDFEIGKLGFQKGETVTHIVSRRGSDEQFFAVFANGGNVHQVSQGTLMEGLAPIHLVIRARGDVRARIQRLDDLGANLNQSEKCYRTPAEIAVLNNDYALALFILKLGANPNHYSQSNSNWKLIHHLAFAEQSLLPTASLESKEDFEELLTWLESRGESLTKAKHDIKRWQSKGLTAQDRGKLIQEEVRKRKQREASEEQVTAKEADARSENETDNAPQDR